MELVDGRFQLERLLGRGGFGEAHLARDRDGRAVVVKLLHQEHAGNEGITERFRREVVALERLRHPNVVELVAHGHCIARGQPYYAMEFSSGVPLDKVLSGERRFGLDRAAAVLDQALAGLEAAHSLGIIHRDMKPANLLLEEGDRVRIIDFGLAKHTRGGAQTVQDITGRSRMGSPQYMAPEQCEGHPTSEKTDVYALGCLLMELLSGAPPFVGNDVLGLLAQHATERAPRLDERLPEAPSELVALVSACLAKDPAERPDTASLRRALSEVARNASRRAGAANAPVAGRGIAAPAPSSVGRVSTGRNGPARPARDPRPGERLGGYPLERTIGEGGFGRVFLTRLVSGEPAALKALIGGDAEDLIETGKRFQREVRLLRSLVHPALPHLHDAGVEDGIPYAVLELIPGNDLSEILERERRLPTSRILPILARIVPALDFAHSRGVIHCDLKPGNIRVRQDGLAFLLDLGIAKIRDGSHLGGRSIQTAHGLVFGTVEYLAPEIGEGRQFATPASDLYSLGVVLFECLAGRLPFLEKDPLQLIAAHRSSPAPDLGALAPDAPRAVTDVVLRCLAKNPRGRPRTAGEVLRVFEDAPAAPPLAATQPAPPPVLEQPAAPWRPTGRRDPAAAPAPAAPEAPPAVEIPPTRVVPVLAREAASAQEPAVALGAVPPTRVVTGLGLPPTFIVPPADAAGAPSAVASANEAGPIPPTRIVATIGSAPTRPPGYARAPSDSLPSAILIPPPPARAEAPQSSGLPSAVPIPLPADGSGPVAAGRSTHAPPRSSGAGPREPEPPRATPTRVVVVPASFTPSSGPHLAAPVPRPAAGALVDLSAFGPDALCVVVLSGRSAGVVQVVEGLRGELVVGRDPTAFVAFDPDESGVSRRHAALVVQREGVSIRDLGGIGGSSVEGAPVGPDGLPLARGAVIRLGDPCVLLAFDTLAVATSAAAPMGAKLRRVDRHAPLVALDGPRLLGRDPEAATPLDAERDFVVSNRHARITPRAGRFVLEDLASANGTFVNGQRTHVALLGADDEIALGGPDGPRYLLEVVAPPPPPPPPPPAVRSASSRETIPPSPPVPAAPRARTAKLGSSRELLADSGDANRAKLEVEFEGRTGVLFLFAGTRLRFGRNSSRGPKRENDLVLRAFPRPNEDPKLVQKRTNDVSGHHGSFLLTRDGVAVRDDGSTLGSELDGVALVRQEVVALGERFVLELARVLALRGKVICTRDGHPGERPPGIPAAHPVEALRLDRTRDGEHMSYVLVAGEVSVGSGDDDAVFLPHSGVEPGHARLVVRGGTFAIGPLGDAPVLVGGRPVASGEVVGLEPGNEITIGSARIRFSLARDEDMKPAS